MDNPGESANSTAKTQERITYGETLLNGTILDLVEAADQGGLTLLSWDGKETLVRPVVEYGGISYRPPKLAPSIREAITFPSGASGYGTILDLFTKVAGACGEHLGLPEDWAALATCWILSSWVPELILIPFTLCISGAFLHQVCNALRLFGSLCRHSLLVAELDRRLPFFLGLTLMVNDPMLTEETCDSWRAAGCRGLFVAGPGGTVCSLRCTKAVVLQADQPWGLWGPEAMVLELPPIELPPLSDRLLKDIAAEFQPQLEMFRLRLLSGTDPFVSKSHPLSRFALARNLGACIPEDAGIVRVLTSLLESHEEELLAQRSRDPRVAVLQAVWAPSHEQREMSVGEITTRANAILRSLGDLDDFNAKEIGWKLRNLKLSTSPNGKRRVLRFSGGNRSRIHQCVREFGLKLPFSSNCSDCKGLQATE